MKNVGNEKLRQNQGFNGTTASYVEETQAVRDFDNSKTFTRKIGTVLELLLLLSVEILV